MASSSTEPPADTGADIGSDRSQRDQTDARTPARPDPLSAARLDKVPGVLGRIARERAADYAARDHAGSSAAATVETPIQATPARTPMREALLAEGVQVIAEIKRSSPSEGAIAPLEPVDAARAYQRGGAAALSVLTEARHFGGELAHLEQVAHALPTLPILRKDFTVHPEQLDEARTAGANTVLLIAAVLGPTLTGYLAYARRLGLDALVEVHDEPELDLALAAGADLIGVNNRDLRSLEVDLHLAPRLIRLARERGFVGVAVAESGYREPEDLERLEGLADAVLVGTSLAGSGDLEGALRRLIGPRAAGAARSPGATRP